MSRLSQSQKQLLFLCIQLVKPASTRLINKRGRGELHTAAANFSASAGIGLARADARVEGLVPGAATLVEVEGGHVDVGGGCGGDGQGGGEADHRENSEERELHFE